MIKLSDILNQYGDNYCEEHGQKLTLRHQKVIRHIQECRTAKLGGNSEHCEDCGELLVHYNSCRDRHCNQCQSLKQLQWVEARCTDALPVPYYHVVFTVPHILHPMFIADPDICLRILFKAASETVKELAGNPKFYHAQIGIISTLHTWGQNLEFHPHIHMMIPAIGLSPSGLTLVQLPKKFFLPVKTLSRVFRAKFAAILRDALTSGKTNWRDGDSLIESAFEKDWVVYSKKPFCSTWHLIKYLAAYTHKIAISNQRILSLENGVVSFKWKDYRDGLQKVMNLDVYEFIRRYLLHVLPQGFVRIRHYGILSNANRNRKLTTVKRLMNLDLTRPAPRSTTELLAEITGHCMGLCPKCGGKLIPGCLTGASPG